MVMMMKTSKKKLHYKKLRYLYLLLLSFIGTFVYSWIACLLLVVVTVLLKRFTGMQCIDSLLSSSYLKWSNYLEMMILDDAAVATSIIGNAISQTNELYLSHLRDFFTLSIVVQFSTPIKAYLYTIKPDWVDSVADKIYRRFSADDSDPPALEVDPTIQQQCDANGNAKISGKSPSSHNTSQADSYIFDPVYGVIPKSVRDMWKEQERNAIIKRETAIAKFKYKKIPPVRYS